MGSATQIDIDGSEVIFQRKSLSIEKRVETRSVAEFTVIDREGDDTYVKGMPIEIYDSLSTLIFGGFVDTPIAEKDGPGLLHFITCVDNHYLADKRLVVKVYSTTGQTLKDIVEDIVTSYLAAEGVTIGEVQTGPVIASPAIFNYVKASVAFDELAEISGLTWYIDELKRLYFIARITNLAPWDLDNVTYRPNRGSVRLDTGNPLYRNRQYVRGGKGVTLEQTEIFTGDGVTVAFTVGYPLALEPSGSNGSINVTNRAPTLQTVGIKGLDEDDDCYWNKGDATITFDVAPENGETVTIVYYGQYPLIVLAENYAEVLSRQTIEGGTGLVEEITTEARHETADAMRETARGKLTYFSRDAEKFIYETHTSGLSPGQLQEITYSPFGFSAHEMFIEAITITADGDLLMYSVSAITGPTDGGWEKFFTRLIVERDNQIKMGDSLLLVLLLQSETLELTEVTRLDTDDFSDGETNRWLNAPPIDAGSLNNVEHELLEMTEATAFLEKPTERYYWSDGAPASDGRWPYTFPIVFSDPWPLWGFFTWG